MASVPTRVLVVRRSGPSGNSGDLSQAWGFEVASAANGEEGARLAESHDPDIVLSDVMMPGTSGVALLKSLQAEDSSRPVILMTGYSTADLAVQAIKDGARDLLSKPLDYPKLKLILEATRTDLESLKKSKDSHCN